MNVFEEYGALQEVASAAEAGKLKQGLDHAFKILEADPLNIHGLILGSYCSRRMGGAVLAYHLALAAMREEPQDSAIWLNLGGAAQNLWLLDEAENAYRQALRFATTDHHKHVIWLNLSALYTDNGQFAEGEEWATRLLEAVPDHRNARGNLGFCQLARRDWVKGWAGYRNSIGCDWRPKIVYNGEPEWDGSPNKVVVLYQDQGLGDGISFASMLPDAVEKCRKVILDCEPKLANLFKRSFPKVTVYPTIRETGGNGITWDKRDRNIEASYPLGQIGEFFRLSDSSFLGHPYLRPCPTRTPMWKRKFETLSKPVIGIAWTGGVARTNARHRQLALTDLLPLFVSLDAHFVCLQYKDASKEIEAFRLKHPSIDLVQYPWATLTNDYDDTAALVAAMDHVVCMQTAVGHCSAALGVPTTVLIPTATTWRYGTEGDTIPWYNSMRIVRQETHGQWTAEIGRVAQCLAADLGELSAGAGKATCCGELRGGGSRARPNGRFNHSEARDNAST